MINKKIYLFPDREDVYLETFVPDPLEKYTRKAILVIPGGGYAVLCSEREGEPVAEAFIPYGYAGFVLHYSINRVRPFPAQLIEASAAIKHIRDHAEEYGIDPEQVFVTGFSAGGHLTASIGVLWHLPEIYDAVPMPYGYNKPSGVIPVYGVITAEERYCNPETEKDMYDTLCNLLCTDTPTKEQLDTVSLEKHVDERSAPCCMIHSSDDEMVPVENALLLAKAYADCGHAFAMHIYQHAPHAMALGNAITGLGFAPFIKKDLEKWVETAVLWAESL
jgi:acetyl esterase/lipase